MADKALNKCEQMGHAVKEKTCDAGRAVKNAGGKAVDKTENLAEKAGNKMHKGVDAVKKH